MPKFIFAYHGGEKQASPAEDAELMAKWKVWVDNLGDALVEPGNPVGISKTVSADGVTDGGGANPLSGYSVLSADNIDVAVEIAQSCPHLEMKTGTIEVAEIFEM